MFRVSGLKLKADAHFRGKLETRARQHLPLEFGVAHMHESRASGYKPKSRVNLIGLPTAIPLSTTLTEPSAEQALITSKIKPYKPDLKAE